MLERKFCRQCGTPMVWTGEGFALVVLISLSSLDDPEAHSPAQDHGVSYLKAFKVFLVDRIESNGGYAALLMALRMSPFDGVIN